ncbi:MAG TPA: hypothetical protein DCK79_04435 [Candidatus Atribacteria bacterium]|nr:hypothetical protein [Candidatus Atribacteria bacterium]
MKKIKRFLYFFKKNITSQKGMALMTTLIFVAVLTTLGITLLTMTRNETKLSTLQEESTKAFYLAEAGVERAVNWLELQGTPPGAGDVPSDFDGTHEYDELNTGKYTVNLSLDVDPGSLVAQYIIETEGWITRDDNSKSTRKIKTAVKVTNFAEYAYFSDDERFPNNSNIPGSSGYVGAKIWFTGNDTIGGKLHSNSQLHMVDVPTFLGKVTSTADTIDFWGDAYAADGSDFPGFMDEYELGVDNIALPQYRNISDLDDENSLQRIAGGSWSKTDIQALSDGVYVPNIAGPGSGVSGGIYIQGDANIELNVDGSAGGAGPNSEITIVQGGNTTIITSVMEPIVLPAGSTLNGAAAGGTTIPANTTLVQIGTTNTYESYEGITNGLLFIDGSINSLHGDNHRGKMTIASNESINVTDNIYYYDRNESLSIFDDDIEAIDDSLGLIAAADLVIDRYAPHNIEVDAVIMALNTSFFYDGWKWDLKGTLSLLGGLIQKARGPVGTHSAGTKITGYSKNYNYDIRMANPAGGYLPPFFPSTGQYEKIYWKEVY